ncbi:MAG: hypothetical protein KDA33_17810 [Phycisphaerales bacterium]|nr:hypothetical protein [Phycisphaerales bacterium]
MAETNVGAEHDLAHYAVETTLGYRQAFYGLLAGGMNIGDFDVAGASTKIELPPEAGATEFIVGLLEMELIGGDPIADFNAELARAMANTRKPTAAPVISDADLATMRERVLALKRQWRALPEGESITLDWVAPE